MRFGIGKRQHVEAGRKRTKIAGFALVALGMCFPGAAIADVGADAGAEVFSRCKACHALERNRTGPKLCHVVGREVGAIEGFHYSDALRQFGGVWTVERLSAFLESPTVTIRGTRMGYGGVKDADERAHLIRFLQASAQDPSLCP